MLKYRLLIIKIAGLLVVFGLLGYSLIFVNTPAVKQFATNHWPIGAIVIVLYTVACQVFAPLSSSPAILLGISVFGLTKSYILLYIAGLISSTINFFIAKKYGRKLVVKLAGPKMLAEIDKFSVTGEVKLLIVGRLLGFFMFDVVSYAFGLSDMLFKPYFIVTAIFSGIPLLFVAVFFKNIDFSSLANLTVGASVILILGIIASTILSKYLRKPR